MVTFDEEIKSTSKSKVKIAGSNKNIRKVEIDKENKCMINIILNKALELDEDKISFDEGFVVDLNSNRNEKIEQVKIQ